MDTHDTKQDTTQEQNNKKTYEIGPGKVLCNLIRRIANEIEQTNISTIEDLDKLRN